MAMKPIPFFWDGEKMVPLHRFFGVASKQYEKGTSYILEVLEPRSIQSQRHYHASIGEAFKNLPSSLTDEYKSPEHLRKKALIRVGYADESTYVCRSAAEATRLQGFIQTFDEYTIVERRGNVIKRYTAQSQSMHAMGKKAFQDSKERVLDFVANLIGVDVATLSAQNPPDHDPGGRSEEPEPVPPPEDY